VKFYTGPILLKFIDKIPVCTKIADTSHMTRVDLSYIITYFIKQTKFHVKLAEKIQIHLSYQHTSSQNRAVYEIITKTNTG
jgi:RIO-like serine/threonine protein kinase